MRAKSNRGFTLVELMLAMSFLSMLLLAIALLIIQIVSIYTKGVTLGAVDQAGQIVSSEIQRTLNESSADDIKIVKISDNVGKTQTGIRICNGTISYVTNFATVYNNDNLKKYANKYQDSGSTDIRFVKVNDSGASLCQQLGSGEYPNVSQGTELLAGIERDVLIHAMYVISNDVGSQSIYTIHMVIGTGDQTEIANATDAGYIDGTASCKPPSDNNRDFCAINQFEFTARAGNQSGSGVNP